MKLLYNEAFSWNIEGENGRVEVCFLGPFMVMVVTFVWHKNKKKDKVDKLEKKKLKNRIETEKIFLVNGNNMKKIIRLFNLKWKKKTNNFSCKNIISLLSSLLI